MRALIPTDGTSPMVTFGERPEPAPAAHEAIVAVQAYSLNRGETFLLERPRPDLRPGKDLAGTILKPAADGSGWPAGTRVVAHPPFGGWAERVAVATTAMAPLPPGVTSEHAAALPLAGLTALRLLRAAPPLAGRRVLLTGASGGVGHYLTELAAGAGARMTCVTATQARGARLHELGAESIVTSLADVQGRFDVIFESVGGTALPRALQSLRAHGHLIWFGQASREPVTLDFFSLFAQAGASVTHFHYEDSDETIATDLAVLVGLLDRGRLHPEIGFIGDWGQTARAIDTLRARELRGKAVLRVR
ncbi:MAG TPA: zinc-binding dehydrogenase [Solirubrobacteraceae bacterium]|nr:zinc-binding dehydrogenase [Solirubrobacteraceae bacterium]